MTIGDRVRIIDTNEGAEIIRVIDEFHAIVDCFDGEVEVTCNQVQPFKGGDATVLPKTDIRFKPAKPAVKKSQPKSQIEFNLRKNQFSYELDLHAERLFADRRTKPPGEWEILPIQISRVKQFLKEAIALRIQRVYIIHGIGSGRLKAEVDNVLRETIKVKSFSNSYHPKYGMGATEVILH